MVTIIILITYLVVSKRKAQIEKLINKYNELIMYGIFGVLTTLINLLTFYVLDKLGVNVYLNNSIAWVISIIICIYN